jgi:predicted RNA-binding protein with PIN domain
MERLIVDGMNVLGSRPDGWWRDRPAAMAGLTRRLSALAAGEGVELRVVFDGNPHRQVAAAAVGIEIGFAPGGPDAADREIVAILHADAEPATIVVVTSDRRLRNSVKAAGARSVGAGELLRRLESFERSDAPGGD